MPRLPAAAGSLFTPLQASLESHTHRYLFERAQRFSALHDYESAIFICERLRVILESSREGATEPSEIVSLTHSLESVHFLTATATYQQQNARTRAAASDAAGIHLPGANAARVACQSGGASYAYHALKAHHQYSEENQLFFAQCCFETQRFSEAEQVMLTNSRPNTTPSAVSAAGAGIAPDVLVPGGALGCLLLGRCCVRSGRSDVAAEWLKRALELEPLCWSAWSLLCQLGKADSAVGAACFQVDFAEFEASCTDALTHTEDRHGSTTPTNHMSANTSTHANPLLATPSGKLLAPLTMLSLTTPAPRQLFTTPFTGGPTQTTGPRAGPPDSAAAATAAGGSFLTPPQHTPTRAKGFASPPTSVAAAKPRARGHVRAQSSSNTSTPTGGAASARPRKVVGRLQWESTEKTRHSMTSATPAAAASSADYLSDDANGGAVSEKERNERKLGRRMNRSAVLATPQVKTPRGPDASGPTTPRRGSSATSSRETPNTARKDASARVTPAQRRATAAAPPAVAPRKRLPEIAESTPDSQATSSVAHTPATRTNLLQSLQTPLTGGTSTNATPFVSSRHTRARSQPAVLFQTPLLPEDDSDAEPPADNEVDAIMVHADEEDETSASPVAAAAASNAGDDAPNEDEESLRAQLRSHLHASAQYLTTLFQTLAEGYRLQHLYQCKESLATYTRLPSHHFHTHGVLTSIARCYFDMQDYTACCRFYSDARALAHSLTGMDVYSTALWHLGDAPTLSSLALWCMELDSLSAEGWVVVGNVFSLAKEHDLSLKFFRRAIQCDRQPYAYTLSAHEYMANEDFDRAEIGYRLSIGVDERFYSAWYGLGNLYLRQEKYAMAAYHFQRAIAIHPTSSVLHCYLGMTLHESKRHAAALREFQAADELDPNNPLAKYHMAHVYLALGEESHALRELHVLKEIAPREANVHFLMGRIQKRMGQLDQAMFHFVTALELDPKDRTQIKAAIDHLHSGNLDEEDASEI